MDWHANCEFLIPVVGRPSGKFQGVQMETPQEDIMLKRSTLHVSKLQFATLVYGLLYLIFILLATIPSTRSLIIENKRPDSVVLELVLAQLIFVLFLVGCIASWRSELVTGMIFLLWYEYVCWMDLFSTRYGAGGGMGPALGFPILVIGILFVFVAFRFKVRGLGNDVLTAPRYRDTKPQEGVTYKKPPE